VEKTTVRRALDLMDIDVELSFSIHCQYRRLDYGGSGPTTLVGLWLVENRERFFIHVSAGNALFTLIGFMGMYTVLSVLYLFLMWREIAHGPEFLTGPNAGASAARLSPTAGV
jgi:hypothetical protein